jgi:hypothetical protein
MKTSKLTLAILFLSITQLVAQRQENKNEFAILFGLNQPLLLSGFNVEVNYFTSKFVFDYSHGISLDLTGNLVTQEMQDQQLVAHLPYSTGFGVGYRFTKFLNLRVEPKWHRFEIYYEGEDQTNNNLIQAYNTFTLGLGLYGKWMPFEKKESFLRNIMVAPSVRFWPNVSTSLNNDQLSYNNKFTGQTETQQALNIGAGNTPWVVNISVGYRFH